jgi:hypothetical protein
MGAGHVQPGTTINYAFCPPTSGQHYNIAGQAPLRRGFYTPESGVRPGNWVHNLEHGHVVFAYRGTPDQATLDAIRQTWEDTPGGPLAASCGVPNSVLVVRFDEMTTPFAALAWDRALLLDEWNAEQAMAFAAQWQDNAQGPEHICP